MDSINDLNQTEGVPEQHLTIDDVGRQYLYQAARWARFLAIIGFIFIGLIVVMASFMGTVFSGFDQEGTGLGSFGGPLISVVYLIMAGIYLIPTIFLFLFGKKTMEALERKDQILLNEGLENQKSLFKFLGIITIIVLALYALGVLAAIIIAAVA